jgi:hypothetical protein
MEETETEMDSDPLYRGATIQKYSIKYIYIYKLNILLH